MFGAEGTIPGQGSPPLGNFCEMGLLKEGRREWKGRWWGRDKELTPYISPYTSQLGPGGIPGSSDFPSL